MTKPKLAKAFSEAIAKELLRVGWTLKREIREDGHDEPCEYVFEWETDGEPIYPIAYKTGCLPN